MQQLSQVAALMLAGAIIGALLRYRIDTLIATVHALCAHHTGRHTRRSLAASTTTDTTEAGATCTSSS